MYGMYGYGRGGGGGRGMGGGAGRREFAPAVSPDVQPPAGYRYVGSCRCGFGPNAYYQDSGGRIVPAAAVFSSQGVAQPQANSEIETLKAEKADIERRLRDLEERLKGTA